MTFSYRIIYDLLRVLELVRIQAVSGQRPSCAQTRAQHAIAVVRLSLRTDVMAGVPKLFARKFLANSPKIFLRFDSELWINRLHKPQRYHKIELQVIQKANFSVVSRSFLSHCVTYANSYV